MSSPTLLETDRTGPEANISRLNCNDKTTDGRNLVLWKDVLGTWLFIMTFSGLTLRSSPFR